MLGQAAVPEQIIDLQPAQLSPEQCNAEGRLSEADGFSHSKTDEAARKSLASLGKNGVRHVGWLRAGNMRQPVSVLADGRLIIYRDNGMTDLVLMQARKTKSAVCLMFRYTSDTSVRRCQC